MSRPFVHLEVREAMRLGRQIILVHEQDSRFNAVDFAAERQRAPPGKWVCTAPTIDGFGL